MTKEKFESFKEFRKRVSELATPVEEKADAWLKNNEYTQKSRKVTHHHDFNHDTGKWFVYSVTVVVDGENATGKLSSKTFTS